ncbi:MAG: hypothetical protein HKO07_01180, partial [Pseudomonadales bacterium]|nr:hypothetical protein [Pseudomonadales bacterium]
MLTLCVACAPGHTWSEQELQIIRSLSLASLGDPPIPDSNRVATNPQAAQFGEKLFHDPALSASGKLSCATCHQPGKFFTDGLSRGHGEALLSRNTPTVAGLAWHTWFYWDGRKDSLWSQALAPIEAPAEMNSSRLQVARLVGQNPAYRAFYQKLFGEYPEILLQPRTLAHASPIGDAERKNNWYRVPAGQRDLINRVFANTGKALGAYVRTLKYSASHFDRYV